MSRWVGTGGIEVECIVLDGRQTLRVTWAGGRNRYVLAYCRSVRELARHVDLADLVEVASLADHRESPSPGA